MKSITTRLMIAAAALAVASGAASAQAMKADIPFAFRLGDALLEPGSYRVDVASRNGVVFLMNTGTKSGAAVLSNPATAARVWQASGIPMLAFECSAGQCALAKLWTGPEGPAYVIPHRKTGGGEQASVTLIRMVKANGD